MNIVFLNPSGALGGAEMALVDLMAALREVRPAWRLGLIASSDGPLVERASRLSVKCVVLPFPPSLAALGEWGSRGKFGARLRLAGSAARTAFPTLRYQTQLRKRLSALNPDIVHTNGLKMHVLGARCMPGRARLVWHLHDYVGSRPLTAALLRRLAPRCAGILVNSDSVARHSRELFGATLPIHRVYNSLDLEKFHPQGHTLDLDTLSNLPALPDAVRVGFIGTFARWKGHDVFLRALSRLGRRRPMRAYVIGEPIYVTRGSQFSIRELRDLAKTLRLGDAVGFTGRVDDVPGALRALDIVVHASVEPEPFGLVIAEAMACGRPIVVSRAGGAAEIAAGCALFHQPGDVADLANCLERLIDDPSLRTSLARAGRSAAERLFSRCHLTETLIPIYESLVPKN